MQRIGSLVYIKIILSSQRFLNLNVKREINSNCLVPKFQNKSRENESQTTVTWSECWVTAQLNVQVKCVAGGPKAKGWRQHPCLHTQTITDKNSFLIPVDPPLNSRCELPKVSGPCNARLPRYYFNIRTRRCERFFFGSCCGNANKFLTEDSCNSACL